MTFCNSTSGDNELMRVWISVFRKLQEKSFYKRSEFFHLWVHLILKVNCESKEIVFNNQPFRIERGQTVTSRRVLSQETGIEESKIHRILKYFEDEQQLKQRGLFSGRLITILNYNEYQNTKRKSEQPNEQRSEHKQ